MYEKHLQCKIQLDHPQLHTCPRSVDVLVVPEVAASVVGGRGRDLVVVAARLGGVGGV